MTIIRYKKFVILHFYYKTFFSQVWVFSGCTPNVGLQFKQIELNIFIMPKVYLIEKIAKKVTIDLSLFPPQEDTVGWISLVLNEDDNSLILPWSLVYN